MEFIYNPGKLTNKHLQERMLGWWSSVEKEELGWWSGEREECWTRKKIGWEAGGVQGEGGQRRGKGFSY